MLHTKCPALNMPEHPEQLSLETILIIYKANISLKLIVIVDIDRVHVASNLY